MAETTFEMTMLLDFYGELLTEKQRECFHLHYDEDLSLAEIAEIMDISRQGVRDSLVRAKATLIGTEEKIGLISRFSERREIISRMSRQLDLLEEQTNGQAREIVLGLKSELEAMSI